MTWSSVTTMSDHRGHLFARSTSNGMPVLRCRFSDCGHVWWPDESRPRKACYSSFDTRDDSPPEQSRTEDGSVQVRASDESSPR